MLKKICLNRMAAGPRTASLLASLLHCLHWHSLPSSLCRLSFVRFWLRIAAAASLTLAALTPAHAGIFDDAEARKAILDLRERTTSLESQLSAAQQALLDQNNQIVQLQRQTASLRGQNDELVNQLTTLQKAMKEYYADLHNQVEKLTPKPQPEADEQEGTTAAVAPAASENEVFNSALKQFRQGNFKEAATAFRSFLKKYPQSTQQPAAQYWLGNALYAQRDYKASNAVLLGLVKHYPTHARAPEALLAVAQNQLEQGQKNLAKQTLQQIIKQYPRSEAARTAKTRLK